MQMRKILCSPSLAFDSAPVKYGVWTWPKKVYFLKKLFLFSVVKHFSFSTSHRYVTKPPAFSIIVPTYNLLCYKKVMHDYLIILSTIFMWAEFSSFFYRTAVSSICKEAISSCCKYPSLYITVSLYLPVFTCLYFSHVCLLKKFFLGLQHNLS